MRRLLAILCLLACSLSATFVQSNQATATSVAFTSANTAGNLLVCGVENNSYVAGPLTVTDTAGNTWTPLGTETNSESQVVALFYTIARSGPNTVSVAGTGGNYTDIAVEEDSGVSVFDGSAAASGNGTSAATGNFAVTSGDLVVAMGVFGAGGTTAGSGFTSRGTDTFSMLEDQIASGSTANATLSGTSHPWAMVAAAFKPASTSFPPCTLATLGAGGCIAPVVARVDLSGLGSLVVSGQVTYGGAGQVSSLVVRSAQFGPEILSWQIVMEDVAKLTCTSMLPCAPIGTGGKYQAQPDWSGRSGTLAIGLPAATLEALGLGPGFGIALER